MDGIHDMGGMDGFGKVEVEQNEPPFHQQWEGRVLALQRALGYAGAWHIDHSRYAQERLPPVWYKSAPYRSRVVKEPRAVLGDFGVALPDSTEIRVWDSTAETRFLVLPMRPKGTEGWSEERLAELVTRDSMIGTGLPKQP